eukprot:102823-Chlamydomonas_euryale.AAC.1
MGECWRLVCDGERGVDRYVIRPGGGSGNCPAWPAMVLMCGQVSGHRRRVCWGDATTYHVFPSTAGASVRAGRNAGRQDPVGPRPIQHPTQTPHTFPHPAGAPVQADCDSRQQDPVGPRPEIRLERGATVHPADAPAHAAGTVHV